MAYIAADYIIIPTDADDGSVNGIRSVFSDLNEYREAEWSDAEVMGVIFTRSENTGMHKYQEDKIRDILKEKAPDAFLMRVRKGIAATECKTEGGSMQAGKKYSNPAVDYRRISEEIIRRLTE
jgi:chromosome partitioning protein